MTKKEIHELFRLHKISVAELIDLVPKNERFSTYRRIETDDYLDTPIGNIELYIMQNLIFEYGVLVDTGVTYNIPTNKRSDELKEYIGTSMQRQIDVNNDWYVVNFIDSGCYHRREYKVPFKIIKIY